MFNSVSIYNNDEKILKITEHIKEISSLLGIEVTDSNIDTPYRVAKMYVNEVFSNLNKDVHILNEKMKVFKNEGGQSPITVRDIPFNSMCEHHWMPFMGTVSVTYIPDKYIIGLSKIPRVVKFFSKRPQLQERLTKDILNYLVLLLHPKYLKVHITATHTCVTCRGVESPAVTDTEFEYKSPAVTDTEHSGGCNL